MFEQIVVFFLIFISIIVITVLYRIIYYSMYKYSRIVIEKVRKKINLIRKKIF